MRGAAIKRVAILALLPFASELLTSCKLTTLGPEIVSICVPRDNWAVLADRMEGFGKAHGLTVHGEIEEVPAASKVVFNYALTQGFSSWRGDDYDIWLVSNPGNPSEMHVSLILAGEPITSEQVLLAKSFLHSIRDLKCRR
jgi:hypothetical protein